MRVVVSRWEGERRREEEKGDNAIPLEPLTEPRRTTKIHESRNGVRRERQMWSSRIVSDGRG